MSSAVLVSRGLEGTTGIEPTVSTLDQHTPHVNCSDETTLLSASWNQTYECFATGTSSGFRIYTCNPFRETFRRDVKGGGFGIVEMLFRSNILALVGSVNNQQYPPNKVMIWDDHQNRCIGEFSFRSDVRAVKLSSDFIVVVLEQRIYVYDFRNLKLLHRIETLVNPKGLCCLSCNSNAYVMACPGLHKGQVRVEHFGLKVTKFIGAHSSEIACFALTMDGLLLATASIKGTLIRIFNTVDGNFLQEVRRGVEKAEIYSLAFSPNVQWLAVSSDKGTVHLFKVRIQVAGQETVNEKCPKQSKELARENSSKLLNSDIPKSPCSNASSSFAFMKSVLPKYFSSEWSFAQFYIPEASRLIAAFGSKSTIIMVGMNGSFYKCSFDPANGGEMVQQEYFKFIKDCNPCANASVA